jgi:hypothetical protein|tara:strand:- start:511 stop:711 length:201 start_codon:yes stop_codon:yes gene_type:complete
MSYKHVATETMRLIREFDLSNTDIDRLLMDLLKFRVKNNALKDEDLRRDLKKLYMYKLSEEVINDL